MIFDPATPARIPLPPTRVRNGDGAWHWIEGVANNLLTEPAVHAIVINFRDITERQRAADALQHRNAELTALNQIGQALGKLAEPSAMLELVFTQIGQVLDNRNLFIALYDRATQSIAFPIYTMNGQRYTVKGRPRGNGITDHIIRTQISVFIRHDLPDELARRGIDLIGAVSRSFLGVPMRAGDHVIGVIAIQDCVACETRTPK